MLCLHGSLVLGYWSNKSLILDVFISPCPLDSPLPPCGQSEWKWFIHTGIYGTLTTFKQCISKFLPEFVWGLNVLRSSRISQKSAALTVRYGQKKECISFVFYCLENLSIAITLQPLVRFQVEFSAKCTSPNEDFNQVENWKCHMFDFRLVLLDRITNINWQLCWMWMWT